MTPARRRARAACASIAWATAVALLASCAQLVPTREGDVAAARDAPFSLSGRLSARKGSEALAANLQWTHTAQDDTLDLATPMGQTLARLSGTSAGATIELADGRRSTAASFQGLTESAFGVPIPVEGLAYWIRGLPHPGGAFAAERDTTGRLDTLNQDGWAMTYAYADTAVLPRRVTLAYPDIDLRIVIDTWH